jgi:hypothetical protein
MYMNDLYKEHYKLPKKEIKEDYRRWKYLPCSWIVRISIVKKRSTCLMQFPSKSNDFHHRDGKIYPKVHLETQETVKKYSAKRAMLEVSQYLTSKNITKQ